jgi:hypothetical protein
MLDRHTPDVSVLEFIQDSFVDVQTEIFDGTMGVTKNDRSRIIWELSFRFGIPVNECEFGRKE